MSERTRRYFRLKPPCPPAPEPPRHAHAPLPVLVHCHPKDAVPPGPLEPGMIELERDGVVLHAVEIIVHPDGTFGDMPESGFEWARRLTYRHLKREGCLEEYGIPIVPAYEYVELFETCMERRGIE